jgi:hypothetical protein
MKRTTRLLAVASLFALLLPAAGSAQVQPTSPSDRLPTRRFTAATPVRPRSFHFNDLPVRPPSEALPIQRRPPRKWEEYENFLSGLKANPPAIPVTSLSQFTLDRTPASPDGKGGLEPFAPTLGTGFEGITQGGFIPSEPTVAGGPINIFSAGNVSVTVTNKDGTNRVETSGATFFGVPAAEGAISDAQCYYDALHARFVALCFTQGKSPNFSKFYLAVSQTNDARGAWWTYAFDMTLDGSNPTNNWGDYQGLGVSEDKIVFSSQQFSFGGNLFQYSKFRVIDRAAAYSGAALTYVDFAPVATPPGGDTFDVFVTKPARNLTPGDNTIYCLCVRTAGGTRVAYRTITGPPSAPVLSNGNLVSVSSYSPPPDAPQMGSATLVATNDCRPTDFYTRNGVLVATWHTSAAIGGGTSECAVRLFRMRLSDRVVLTDETFGQDNVHYYYPAVTVDSVGTIFLGFDRSSSTEFPSAYATGKRRVDAAIQPSALVKAGVSATSQSRWGDYTGIDQDASLFSPSQTVAWYAGQWTKATNTFGTWIRKLTYTYGQVFGTVTEDCDGLAGTTADRAPVAGITVSLKQGVTTVASTTTNGLGQYSFGYLDSGTYDVVATAPAGGTNVDATAGSGGTSQTRLNASTVQVAMTDAQSSSGNHFVIARNKPLPATTSIVPSTRATGDPQFTLTVNGSGFTNCSVVRIDGFDRSTAFVSANQLTAVITATDQAAGGTKTITVFTPSPGGGTSNGQALTILGTPDTQPPLVTVTSPTGGESWAAGSSHAITWTATDDIVVASVDLALSTDGGATFPTSIATGLSNAGTYSWSVPVELTSQARVRVRAFDGTGNVGSDSSHADFAITGWTISASAGANGTIAPSGVIPVADGATPQFTITPNTGYHVLDVVVNGGSVGAVTQYTFPAVHANQSIVASFAINQYTLTTSVVGSGTVGKSPDQPAYDHGTNVQLTATPAASWNFGFWSGDASGSANPLNVVMDGNKSITANFGQNVYTWNQTGTAAWTTATNWTPTRTVTATNDVLIFDNGAATAIASGVPTQTVGRIVVTNNTNITLQASSAATLTIGGGGGTDLSVAAGSTLQLTGTTAVTLALATGATGEIAGTTNLAGAAHRLTAADPGALVYPAGGKFTAGVSQSGSPFGTTSLNSVVFQAGSLYQHIAGANPFGASAPGSVVTFEPGSRYRLDGPITPSMSGRTYADFEYNNGGTQSPTGGSAVTLDSLVVTQGTFNLNLTGGANIRGNVHVKPGATLAWNPSGVATFTFNGTAPQAVDLQGTFSANASTSVKIENPAGVSLVTDLPLNGPVLFASGNLGTGTRTLLLSATGSTTGASQGTGWVHGNLKKAYVTGAFASTLDVGDATTYAPIEVSGTGAGAGFALTASTTAGDHAQIASSTLDPAHSVNRSWSLAPTNGTGASWSATFHFASSDLDAGTDPSSFLARVHDGSSWSGLTMGTRTPISTQVTGLSTATPGTQFIVANTFVHTLTTNVVGGGSVTRAPDAPSYTQGTNVQLTAVPGAGWAFSAWSGDLTGTNNPETILMDGAKTVTSTFLDIAAPVVTVSAPNGGEMLTTGTNTSLTWAASDNAAVTEVDLALSRAGSGGPWESIATGLANSGTYGWTVTGPITTNAVLRATARDAALNAGQDASDAVFTIADPTAVGDHPVTDFALLALGGNPVRSGLRFAVELPRESSVHLGVHDVQGRELLVLADGMFPSGRHTVDGTGLARSMLGPGLYFVRLTVPGRTIVRRFVYMR